MAEESEIPTTLIEELPTVPESFYRAGNMTTLANSPADGPKALDRLGAPPLPKSGFPFLGFLATVYEHVSEQAARAVAD